MSKPPAKKATGGGGWGSLLSGAVANLERSLDTILAEDSDASVRERAAAQAAKDAKLKQQKAEAASGSREASRARGNERLAERLAKATAAKQTSSQGGSAVPSRVGSPAVGSDSVRTSVDSARSVPAELPKSVPEEATKTKDEAAEQQVVSEAPKSNGEDFNPVDPTLLTSGLPINPARISVESARPSAEVVREDISSRPSSEVPRPSSDIPRPSTDTPRTGSQTPQTIPELGEADKQRQEEMHGYLEKIDALQSKLKYLAKETVAAAKEANASASGNDAARLAEKDQRIALLMEEGEQLSKTELRHTQTIKKLRTKMAEDEKASTASKTKLERTERAEADLKQKLRKAEVAERQANEKIKQISAIEKQVDEMQVERQTAAERIRSLTTQLEEAKTKADRAEREANSKAAAVDKNKIATLENELEDAQIEKKLAMDRAAAESKKVREEASRDKERFGVTELELKNEIRSLEGRLEAMRSRVEEASSEGTGDGDNVTLMRQVETLQNQYSLAKENWQTIESSLNARVSALERERDEATKREADMRKKARELGVRSRKVEDELEAEAERSRGLTSEIQEHQDGVNSMQKKMDLAETALADARADLENKRKLWEVELAQKVEEEKSKWQRNVLAAPSPFSNGSPAASNRKTSGADLAALHTGRRSATRLASPDLSNLHAETFGRPTSRRSSVMPPLNSPRPMHPFDEAGSPSLSRRESTMSPLETPSATGMPPTPFIEIDRQSFSGSNSPQRTLNDLVSNSTAGAGPSVQLVERLSLAVRRLESEKATFKDELTRLSSQRDDARNEIVELMREVETKRTTEGSAEQMEQELGDTKRRYEASLQMLGEKEEEAQDLKQDVDELKRLYRELVEEKLGS